MPSLKATERHQRIMDALSADSRVTVADLSAALGVSSVTIRADLAELERAQALRRIRGGAIAATPSRYERPHELDETLRVAEKRAIAAVAAGLVRDGETIILDTGSTVAAMARAIPAGLANVAVVTNALNLALALSAHPGLTVVVTGGTVRPRLNTLVSPFGALLLEHVNADVAFMSCAGVSPEKGFTNSNWAEAEIKRAMIRAASRVVFLADHSKLRHVASARIAAVAEADMLITDAGASVEAVRELRATGLEVVIA